jgi:hypothetical protein
MPKKKNKCKEDELEIFFKRHELGIGVSFVICGVALAIYCLRMSMTEFTGEDAWLNEPGAWLLLAVLGMVFILAGFAGIMDYISQRDAKFSWVDLPTKYTGRPEPFMRYERKCPICGMKGNLEAQKLHNGRMNLMIFHAKCSLCGYDVELPWLTRGFVFAFLFTMIGGSMYIIWQLYNLGGLIAILEMAVHVFFLIMLGIVLYMVSNYLILKSRLIGRFIDWQIARKLEMWNSPKK